MNYLYTFLALFVGFLLPVQVGINAELARFVNGPLLAALVSFYSGCIMFVGKCGFVGMVDKTGLFKHLEYLIFLIRPMMFSSAKMT